MFLLQNVHIFMKAQWMARIRFKLIFYSEPVSSVYKGIFCFIPVISTRSSQINSLWLLNRWLMAICGVKSTKLTHTDSSNCSSACVCAQFGIKVQILFFIFLMPCGDFLLILNVYSGLILVAWTGMISKLHRKYNIMFLSYHFNVNQGFLCQKSWVFMTIFHLLSDPQN